MRDWKYSTGTEKAIRSALLALLAEKPLADVTVAELCRAAHVSRSTFYEHFGNVADVYDAIVREFSAGISPVMAQVARPGGDACAGMPFCTRLREGGPFTAAVKDDRFLSAFMQEAGLLEKHDLYGLLVGAGYTPDQARAICAFQLAGCFTAARTTNVADDAWPGVKAVLDRFILGGVSACLAAKQAKPTAEHRPE